MSYDSWLTNNPADDYSEVVETFDVECAGENDEGESCEYAGEMEVDAYLDRNGYTFTWTCPTCGHENEEERESGYDEDPDRYRD